MLPLFITFRFLDFLDILIVATMLYHLYKIIKGTVTYNIFLGIFSVYLLWLIVEASKMQLVSSILGKLFEVGVIALIVVFQQEIRRFLIILGAKYNLRDRFNFHSMFKKDAEKISLDIRSIVDSAKEMSISLTGALIILTREAELFEVVENATKIDSVISKDILKSIFFKNSPLHDGAVVISHNRIIAARAILPLTNRIDLDPNLGLRHRAAIGVTESSDAIAVIVSEETGAISVVDSGEITRDISPKRLEEILKRKTSN